MILLMSVADHYDASAVNYHRQYERDGLRDITRGYPANFFRLQMLVNSFVTHDVHRVIEVGVGEGTPLATIAMTGADVAGFDISQAMVDRSKRRMLEIGVSPDTIIWGDIEDSISYVGLLANGRYDAMMAMGVMPHVRNDRLVLSNMASLVKPDGLVFIEFRNKLFSMFTLNRLTYEFIMEDLLAGVSNKMKDIVGSRLKLKLEMDKPSLRDIHSEDGSVVGYDAILSKFHNPFEVLEQFDDLGFKKARLLWYHYHPAMPFLADVDPQEFRDEQIRLEHEGSGWRGFFLCSAFVVQAHTPQSL